MARAAVPTDHVMARQGCWGGMSQWAHLDLDVLFERSGNGYRARVVRSPAGEGQFADFALPVTALELENLALKIGWQRGQTRSRPAEWEQVTAAIAGLTAADAIAVTELAEPTLKELRRALAADKFHVLHYMGHGIFDAERGGALVFTDQAGHADPVTAESLGVLLRDHASMRLAIIDACDAARTDPADPFAGIADTLVRRGIPAVVAMPAANQSVSIPPTPWRTTPPASHCAI